ncbi:uncharacterized protein LOC126719909 [Quercus robur]|uniref:uncharacterized protein LOC126719909 n=1 Tax=Quercus robur TaxID=38942 RepID=UPI002162C0FC|nr:uncharacterized protein LOC126719909 [Quercus robur]
MVRAKDPSAVFLAETWADEARLKAMQRDLNFHNLFFVERNNEGGGLALYWSNSINLNVESYSKNHFDAIINKGERDAWRFIGFYGEPVTHKRHKSWDMLRQLNNRFKLPWLCSGNFNEIVKSFIGSQFTWQKHFADRHSIWERLDRGLANNDWFMKFAGTKIHHLTTNSLDHCPLWIVPKGLEIPSITKPFRFEEMWLSDRGCTNVVEAVWASHEEADPSIKVIKKIKKCGKELQDWNRKHFGNVKRELEKKRKLLREAEAEAMRTGVNFRVRELKKEIDELVDKEYSMWFQRSKVLWATNGDKNSKYFHCRATQRKRKNSILKICKADGEWSSDMGQVTDTLTSYFQELYTSANLPPCEPTTDSINQVINEEMNEQLFREFQAWEVQQAIKQMAPLKAPGPDGKNGFMAIKLDMSKAYDRVEWPYLAAVMKKLGFNDRWIKLLMLCVTTVSYSILVNGEPKGLIHPSKGIKQGDPISPFLFLLCTEGFLGLISQAAAQGDIRGYSFSRNSPRLTHLFFADDSLLFCRSTVQECQKILDILDTYGARVSRLIEIKPPSSSTNPLIRE